MKKLILAAAVAGAVLLSSCRCKRRQPPEGYQLQQVLMMSRHNLRAPLANNGSVLEQSTPNQMAGVGCAPAGLLTTKAVCWKFIWPLHARMAGGAGDGHVRRMPTPDTVYTYANSLQRTVATAQFFITGAFPGCDIPVHHQEKNGHDGPNV